MIDNSQRPGYPVGIAGRVLLAVWCVFLTSGFLLAASLEPDPRGFGTHQRLGFPPCTFQVYFRVPCPSCGMTTSFSHFVRGEFLSSARANLAGLALAAVCAVQVPWSLISLWQGRLWRIEHPDRISLVLIVTLCLLSLFQWGLRLAGL